MTQSNILNVKLYNWQFSKLKSKIKYDTELTLNLSLNMKWNLKGFLGICSGLKLTTNEIKGIT